MLRCLVEATFRALHSGLSRSCNAFVRPDGVNVKLPELADDGLIDGFTTDVAAYEFVYDGRARAWVRFDDSRSHRRRLTRRAVAAAAARPRARSRP